MKKSLIGLGVVSSGMLAVGKNYRDYYKKYNILPELRSMIRITFLPQMINRKTMGFINRHCADKVLQPEDVVVSTQKIKSYDGKQILISTIEPDDVKEDEILPCLVYYHGGGYVLGLLSSYYTLAARYVRLARCKIVLPHYRTIYEGGADACFEDSYQALKWTYENAEQLRIDKDRIAVGGDSAGGGISAAVTHMSRDRKGPKICFQMLMYPAVDSSMSTESMKKCTDTILWNSKANAKMWKEMKKSMSSNMLKYASPLSNPDFSGLCNGYVEVEEFDCLHDEGVLYAEKLISNGYEVELNDMKGTYHGFDEDAKTTLGRHMFELRSERLKAAFQKKE